MPVTIVRSGIGKVNAAICTQILVDDFNVDAVINTGIAGSLHDRIEIADVVLSKMFFIMIWMQQDLDIQRDRFQEWMYFHFKADPGLVALAKKACEAVTPEIGVTYRQNRKWRSVRI